jgi:hypothetical protein
VPKSIGSSFGLPSQQILPGRLNKGGNLYKALNYFLKKKPGKAGSASSQIATSIGKGVARALGATEPGAIIATIALLANGL